MDLLKGSQIMTDEADYQDIAYQFDKGVSNSWDRMVEDTKDMFREHCENQKELDAFYEEICKFKNLGGLTTDLFAIAYERLSDEFYEDDK